MMGPRERKLREWVESHGQPPEGVKQEMIDTLRHAAASISRAADRMVDDPINGLGELCVDESTMRLCRMLVIADASAAATLREVRRADAEEN